MKSTKSTAGIYGIQDIANFMFPVYVHDHSFVMFTKGKIVKYLQLERHTRIKYDNSFLSFIDSLLKSMGLTDPTPSNIFISDSEKTTALLIENNVNGELTRLL